MTGICSEDVLIDEAVALNELALMGSMLLSLIKFDQVCSDTANSEGLDRGSANEGLNEEQIRNRMLTDFKSCDESFSSVIDQCK